jgi:chromosome partitioning protein
VELENNSLLLILSGFKYVKKVLLIDLDPQANLSQSLGLINQEKTIYGALKGEYKLQPVSVLKGLDVIPSLILSRNRVEF